MQTQKKSAGISHVGVPSEAGAAALHSQENIRTEILDFPTAKEKILKGQLDVFFDQATGKIYYSSIITSSATAAGVLDKAFGSAGGVELVSLSDAAADNIMAYTLIPAGLMLICSMSAGIFAAACTVREREMGTLEPLLSTGVSPFVIVVGKVLSVILASLLSVFICAIGTTLYLRLFLNSLQVITLSFISLLFITGILTVILFSFVFVAIGVMSSNYREAQSYISVVATLTMVPSLFLAGARINDAVAYWFVPVLNWSYAVRSAMYGVYNFHALLLSLIPLLGIVALAFYLAVKFMQSEPFKNNNRLHNRWFAFRA